MMRIEEMATQLKKLRSAVIFCHMRPDGDTLGAAMGLKCMLEDNGARVSVVCESRIPEKFLFLEGMDGITDMPDESAEAYIAVDTSNESRLGRLERAFVSARKKKFNIDHHVSNSRYGDYWYVEDCAAASEVMTVLAESFGPLSKKAAEYLLLGISSDTGNFSHSNVTERTFACAAKLTALGADIHKIYYNVFKRQDAARAKLYGRTMSAIRYEQDGKIAFICVTQKDLSECGASADVTEGFIDFPLSVIGVEVACSLLEVGRNSYKISLRSSGKADVNKIAAVYGGGGHVLASGCMISGSMEGVIDKLRYTVSQYLEG